ncbi:hypothetical protein M011DRAFT_471896 [Sporormia fimetaria CBS 119925]|uniref:Peptidase M48 domain-containing protein n=1 Tax=Sporormia fimetaria CBS 119925 TaxID=1340428 RepID=A0A6A6UX63_9PLEO|nr:hypothetical protein M011DRAFT_471896 [Sporormia fimetaria CBS 119925]
MAQIQEEYRDQFLPDWDPRVQVVKRVLARLIPFAQGLRQGEEVAWEVHVIESPEKNAFVIPGGKVFVFTGILPLCRDEHGIAAVLGHEIAHVVAHHTAEKMSQAPFILLGCLALAMFDVSFYSSKMLFDLFMTLPGSRKQESEADYIGLMMMAQACYRPSAAADFWTRMERISKHEQVPQILSTHPSNTGREDKIREWLPKAFEVQEKAECGVTAGYMEQFGGFGNAVRRRSSDWGI